MNAIFRSILDLIQSVVQSYGLTVILFTLFIKLVLLPFDYKSRKSMRRMEKVNPKLQALQAKYGNDKEKLQKKQAELYKKEKINPLGSCLPMLLTFPVLIIMFGAMRGVANEALVNSLLSIQRAIGDLTDPAAIQAALPPLDTLVEPFLWIKNLWVADSPFTSVLPSASSTLAAVGTQLAGVITADEMTALKAFVEGPIYQSIVLPHYGATIMPGGTFNMLIMTFSLYKLPNGFLILPILSGVTQFFTNSLNPQAQQPQQQSGKGGQQPGMGNFMKWFFPLFSVYICLTSNAAFSLYWVATNVVAMVQQIAFKRYFDAQDRKAAAQSEEVDKL